MKIRSILLNLFFAFIFLLISIFINLDPDAILIYIFSYVFALFLGNTILTIGGIRSNLADVSMFFGVFLVCLLSILQFDHIVSNGSRESPAIFSDAGNYYELGVELSNVSNILEYAADNPGEINHWGYPMFLGILFSVFGIDIIWGMIANIFIFVFNLCIIGILAKKLTQSDKVAGYTFLLAVFYGQFISTGMILLKDGLITMSVLLITLMLIEIYNKILSPLRVILLLFATSLLAVFRAQYIFAPLLLYIFIFRIKFKNFFLLLPILVILLWGGMFLGETYTTTEYNVDSIERQAIGSDGRMQESWGSGEESFMNRIVSGYESWSLVKRAIYMPIFIGIQYLTPFYIWDFEISFDHGYYSYPARNMNLFWFIIIGPLIFIGLYCVVKKRKEFPLLFSVGLSGALMYAVPAFIRAGTVPRYAIPFVMIMLPCGGWLINMIKSDIEIKKVFLKFIKIYYFSGFFAIIIYLLVKI